MSYKSGVLRSISAAAVMGLALSIGAPGAIAQSPTPGVQARPASLIDASQKASLTLHKRANPGDNLPKPTGNENPAAPGTPLEGVGFTIYRINNIDLTTNAGLAAAANIDVNNYLSNGAADTAKVTKIDDQRKTGPDGKISWTDLELGAYLVVETEPLADYTPALPFIAFLPMTQDNADPNQGTTWNYNVHAYPKNYERTGPDKNVIDASQNATQTLTYFIDAQPQRIVDGQFRTLFRIQDTLDSKLTTTQDQVRVGRAGTNPGQIQDIPEGWYTIDVTGQTVTVNFTATGRANISHNDTFRVVIEANIKGDASQLIPNKAQVFENDPNINQDYDNNQTPPPPGRDTPETRTYLGDVQFTKVKAGEEDTELAGAEFQVYGRAEGQTCDQAVAASQPLTAGGATRDNNVWASNGQGVVKITGLHVNDIANEKVYADGRVENIPNPTVAYCLVEIKAPAGFELLSAPVEFTLSKTEVVDGDANPKFIGISGNGQTIPNLPDTTPELPLTGGQGVALLVAIGALIAAIAAFAARRSSVR